MAEAADVADAQVIADAGTLPSCNGLAKTCGAQGTGDCCASNMVTGGTYNRGNDANYPATVSDFRLDVYEVTVGRFRKFVAGYASNIIPSGAGKNPNNAADPGWNANWNTSLEADAAALTAALKCNAAYQTWTDNPGANESLPITCLDWFEAAAFCIWDGGRLPTDAEWNYAAAGGAEQRVYPWGSEAPDNTYANFCGGAGTCWMSMTGTATRVGSESPKGDGKYGQQDLGGNVAEWVQDWYGTYSSPCHDCANLTGATSRVLRGGNFYNDQIQLLNAHRGPDAPGGRNYGGYGVRCAR